MVAFRIDGSKLVRARLKPRSEFLTDKHADFLAAYVGNWSDEVFWGHLRDISRTAEVPPAVRILLMETARRFRRQPGGKG